MTTNSGPSHAYCFEEATGNSLVNQEARLPPQRRPSVLSISIFEIGFLVATGVLLLSMAAVGCQATTQKAG